MEHRDGHTMHQKQLARRSPRAWRLNVGRLLVAVLLASAAAQAVPLIVVSTESLPPTSVGVAYSQTLVSCGGSPPEIWTVVSGSLPAGLSLASGTGEITGTATTAGTSIFTVEVECCAGATGQAELSIVVSPLLQITTLALPGGPVGFPYSKTLTATGGTGALSWNVVAGSLPAGLDLGHATGTIDGTPKGTGTANFTVEVSDTAAATATRAFAIEVLDQPFFTSFFLAPVTVNNAVSKELKAVGGSLPYIWSVAAGSLPPGISLGASSGVLSGTPTAAGNLSFTIRVADAQSHASTQAFGWTVHPDPNVLITTSTLPTFTDGQTANVALAVSGGTGPYTWSVTAGAPLPGLTLAAASGALSGQVSGVGEYPFTVEVADVYGTANSRQLSLSVNRAPQVTTSSLPGATVGSFYSARLRGEGGTPPVQWEASSLPGGINFDSATGRMLGAFGEAGDRRIRVTMTDANAVTDVKSVPVKVYDEPKITTSSIASLRQGQPVRIALRASGGMAPLNWSVRPSLPPGLSINHDGVIRGTPPTAGLFPATFRISDKNHISAEVELPIEITEKPAFQVSPASLRFEAAAGGPATAPQQVVVTSAPTHADFEIDAGADWLQVPLDQTQTPAVLSITAVPGALPAGDYSASIQVNGPEARTVAVELTITLAAEPSVAVDPGEVHLSVVRGRDAGQHLLLVRSVGEDGEVTAQAEPGSEWIAVSVGPPPQGSQYAATLLLTVDTESVADGTHQGSLLVSRGSSSAGVPVSLTVTGFDYELSHSGLTFDIISGGAGRQSQALRIFNRDENPLDWLASTRASWMRLDPPTGTAAPESEFEVHLDAAGLESGVYSDTIVVTPQAGGEQRRTEVFLNLSGEALRPVLAPTGLTFHAVTGVGSDSAQFNAAQANTAQAITLTAEQRIVLTNPNDSAVDYTAVVAPQEAASWLTVNPIAQSLPAEQSVNLTARVRAVGLEAGAYQGKVNVEFAGQAVQVVNVALIVAAETCEPAALVAVFTQLGDQFRARVGWPTPVEVRVTDDCGRSITEGSALVWFSTPDDEPAQALRPGPGGLWTATWVPRLPHASITATATVNSADGTLSGSDSATGAVFMEAAGAWQDPEP
jgi:hypothetical protein